MGVMSLLFLTLGDALEYTVDHPRQLRDEPYFAPVHPGPVRRLQRHRKTVLGILHRQHP